MEPKRTYLVRGDILLRDGRKKNQQEGYRNFNLEAEERFIKKLVDAGGELLDFKDRGQRRKLQLYGERES